MFNEFNNNIKIIGKMKNQKHIRNLEINLNKTDFNKKIKYSNESSYLRQYKKYFQKKLSIKYNILPKEYISIQLDNFVKAKYCHSLAKFKEDLLFHYEQEFLKRYYKLKESIKKLPLFSEFYKTYLLFFCSPTLSELNLNELIEEMVERKAKAFYQENYQEEKESKKNSKKIINTIFFTNKVRKDISRKNSLTDLSKTTIEFMTITNKNSNNSYISINNLINEIGNGDNNKNKNLINKNSIINKQINNINNINKHEKIKKIIKNLETNNFHINNNLIKKKNILKNSTNNIKQIDNNKAINNKKIAEIKVKSINNNTQSNFSNNNILSNNSDTIPNKNKENNYITKPLVHKINIVNNKIIIINNNRSKGNILKVSKEKLKRKSNITSLSRNYNNNFFSTYNNNTIGVMDSKDRIINNNNYNTNTFLLKTFKENKDNNNNNKKGQSSLNCHSLHKSDTRLKHIKIIKEKNINNNNQKQTIQTYNSKKANTNLFANYLNNFKNISNNNNLINVNKAKKKKLTNYQIFSNNIKNINYTQKIKNFSKEKFTPLYKMIHSTCSIGANSTKIKNLLKINTNYNTLENLTKTKNCYTYRKQCSTQEQMKTKLQMNTNALNKNVLSLKLNKK